MKNVPELIALAKSKPGKLTYASSGPGSLQHIAAELFKSMAGVEIVHVPYKGSSQALVDLMSGQVDMNFDAIPPVISQIKAGKVRAVAVTAAKRVPAGTPANVIAKVHRDTLAALQNAELRERFADLSVEPGGGTSQQLADYVAREIAKYGKLVKQLNIKAG